MDAAVKVWTELCDREQSAAAARGKPITRGEAIRRAAAADPAAHAAFIASANPKRSPQKATPTPTPGPAAAAPWRAAVAEEFERRVLARVAIERRDAQDAGGEMPSEKSLRESAEWCLRAADPELALAHYLATGNRGAVEAILEQGRL